MMITAVTEVLPTSVTDLGCVDALDLDIGLEVVVVAGAEELDGEGAGSVLDDGRLRVEAGAHHLLAHDEHVGDGVGRHQTFLVAPLEMYISKCITHHMFSFSAVISGCEISCTPSI